jgi:hypothetical protein
MIRFTAAFVGALAVGALAATAAAVLPAGPALSATGPTATFAKPHLSALP